MNINIPLAKIQASQQFVKTLMNDKWVDKALLTVASGGIQIIQTGTKSGKGYKGSFKPYSKAYAKWKQKHGKHRATFPNLELSGDMMRDMQARNGRGYADIYFTTPESAKKAAWNQRTRPFLGFNTKNREKLINKFVSTYMTQVNRARTKIAAAGSK